MNYTQAAKPFVEAQLDKANDALRSHHYTKCFHALEDAHVIGQQSTYLHTRVHFKMLMFGLKRGDKKEVLGQVVRLIGALTKTAFGLLPQGNTGGANVSAFKPMRISPKNRIILEKIKRTQS